MAKRALVLGGGGPVGIAWESGLLAGLEQEGVRAADADLIVGTSAGSVVGAQLALGRSAQELADAQLSAQEGPRPVLMKPVDMVALIEQFARMYTSSAPPEQLRAEIGQFALNADTMSEADWLATFDELRELSGDRWPERKYVCTGVDAADGSFVPWDARSGVPLHLAVGASCTVPGIFPPVTIDGRRYVDGGMKSATNAELASGYDLVLLVAVNAQRDPSGPFAAAAEMAQRRLDDECRLLRESGAEVAVITPDEGSSESFGENLMDFTRRIPVTEQGIRQGRAEAPRLREFWE